MAATASKVALVETDPRNPSLAHQHGLNSVPGLSAVLTHQVELERAIQTMEVASSGGNGAGGEQALDVIVAGANPPNPAELIESKAMSEVLSRLTERYDLVVLDTAPLGVVADAFPLLREVDGVIAVTRLGRSTHDSAERMREQLDRLEAPMLGIVANGVKARRGGKYGYGYYGPPEERQGATEQGAGAAAGSLRHRIVRLRAPRVRRASLASARRIAIDDRGANIV